MTVDDVDRAMPISLKLIAPSSFLKGLIDSSNSFARSSLEIELLKSLKSVIFNHLPSYALYQVKEKEIYEV